MKNYATRTENGKLQVQTIEGKWLDVKNYQDSLETWPSFARKYLDETGRPCLTEIVTANIKCGCEVVGCGTLQFPLTIEFCKTHGEKPLQQGEWVMYNGKPRQVYKFLPFGPTKNCPAVIRDPRFDMVEVLGIKKPVYVNQTQRMILQETKA